MYEEMCLIVVKGVTLNNTIRQTQLDLKVSRLVGSKYFSFSNNAP